MKSSLVALFAVLLTACPKPSPPPATSILHGLIAAAAAAQLRLAPEP